MITKLYKLFRNFYLRKYGTFDEIMFTALSEVYVHPLYGRIGYWSKENNRILIICERPGMLIGFGGKDLNRLKNFLSKIYNEEIEIDLKEFKDYVDTFHF